MSYDALAESVRLLAGGPSAGVAHLSRRVRHVALAADQDRDVAATMFLRRGVSGVPLLEVHVLERRGDGWRVLGGGGGPGDAARQPRPRLAELGAPAVGLGHGGVLQGSGGLLRRGTWVSWGELRLAEEVHVLVVGTRRLPVAAHGSAIVVWTGEPPAVAAVGTSGDVLGPITLSAGGRRGQGGQDRLPRSYADGEWTAGPPGPLPGWSAAPGLAPER